MTHPTYISYEDGDPKLDWLGLTEAFEAAHKLAKGDISDTFLYRGKDTLLSRSAWIDGMGVLVKSATVFGDNPSKGKPLIHGSVSLLLVLSALFLITSLSMGLLVSTVAQTQQEAMLLSWLILLPTIFLSGFFFPLEAMPTALRLVSYVVPLRYLLVIMRGIVLTGVGLQML